MAGAQNVHDPAVISGVLSALEVAIARALELAPAASRDLQEMAGTVLAVECTAPQIEVFLIVTPEGGLHLQQYSELDVTTRVRGPAESFFALATAEDPAATLINSKLEIIGNTAPLIALQQIITQMDLDWEAPLVDGLGDVVGHQLAQLLRGLLSWGEQAHSSLRRQLSEYILEEGRLSPPAAELEQFYQGVDSLALRVDRLQSRLKRLARRIDEQP